MNTHKVTLPELTSSSPAFSVAAAPNGAVPALRPPCACVCVCVVYLPFQPGNSPPSR